MVAQQQQAPGSQGVMVQAASSSGGNRDVYWVKDANGVLQKAEVSPEDFGMAPKQNFYRLRLKGVSDMFDMDGEFGKSVNVRLLWVINAPGSSDHKKMFSDMASVKKWGDKSQSFYWNISSNSKMGKIIEAITGKPIDLGAGFNLCDYLGGEIQALVKSTLKTDKNGVSRTTSSASWDTIVPVEEAGPAGPNQYAPAPEPVPAATNPFIDPDL